MAPSAGALRISTERLSGVFDPSCAVPLTRSNRRRYRSLVMAMPEEAVIEIISGLKEAGVNFVSLLPDSEFSSVQARLLQDPEVRCVSVINEAIGVSVCAGAWLSGKMPA